MAIILLIILSIYHVKNFGGIHLSTFHVNMSLKAKQIFSPLKIEQSKSHHCISQKKEKEKVSPLATAPFNSNKSTIQYSTFYT